MSRTQTDREDLMAEAVALVRRIEFPLPEREECVVCGFRRSGGISVYLGQDSVFHFDENRRLRRAFRDGRQYRTQGMTLAELTRERGESTAAFVRRDLPPSSLETFLSEMRTALQEVHSAITAGRVSVRRQVPVEDAELLTEVGSVLGEMLRTDPVLAPAIAGKP